MTISPGLPYFFMEVKLEKKSTEFNTLKNVAFWIILMSKIY